MGKGKVNRPQWDSEYILALRRHLGLTQRELAERMGTRQQTISEWEKGMYKPRGASSTLLFIIAERAQFEYKATPFQKTPKKPWQITLKRVYWNSLPDVQECLMCS